MRFGIVLVVQPTDVTQDAVVRMDEEVPDAIVQIAFQLPRNRRAFLALRGEFRDVSLSYLRIDLAFGPIRILQ